MDWLAIVFKFLDPLLAKCFSQVSSEDPKEYLKAHYNESTNRMDASLVRHSMGATARAVREARRSLKTREEKRDFPRYSREELFAMTERRLIEAMNATPTQLKAAFKMAAQLPDEDE